MNHSYGNIFDLGQGQQGWSTLSGPQGGNFYNQPVGRGIFDNPYGDNPPSIPEEPDAPFKPGDVSGFANYGMKPPPLPDPMQKISGLMAMMGDPNVNRKEDPFLQQQPGGLMSYLQMLARG